MRPLLFALLSVIPSLPALALPPDEAGRGFVDGANHHLGDASFVARFGRAPTEDDREKVRMRTHLEYVRAWLAARPPTRPELAARRAELLGYLGEYIARGITPQNLDLPWRNPVFVDALGNVCAVGYLIERSVSRELVERIAAAHRFDYLEDIDMPEVQAWIASSGFTLEELASIQPGYLAPVIETWQTWDLTERRPADGPFELTVDGTTTRGRWRGGQMQGTWTRSDALGRVIGRGELAGGKGAWTSFDGHGRVIAEGPFVGSFPEGRWRFFHASGRLAAEGGMRRGQRIGAWTFYYDEDGARPIARGRFARGGRVAGTWQHFDSDGRVIARTWQRRTNGWEEVLRLSATPRDGVTLEVAEGNFAGDYQRVDALALNGLRLYLEDAWDSPILHDADGRVLVKADGTWTRSGCGWGAALRRAARAGDVDGVRARLLALRRDDDPVTSGNCPAAPLARETGDAIDRMLAARGGVRTPIPEFVRELEEPFAAESEAPALAPGDLTGLLAASMTWYIEWPHVDGRFAKVFATLPGHFAPGTFPDAPEEGEPPPAVTIR